MDTSVRTALRGSLCAAAFVAGFQFSVQAQTAPDIIVSRAPLSDIDCDYNTGVFPVSAPQCTVTGARTVTIGASVRTVQSPTTDRITTSYDVSYDGILAVDGLPVPTGPGAIYPFGNSNIRDAQFFFDDTGQTVDLQTNYVGTRFNIVPTGAPVPPQNPNPAFFTGFNSFTNVVRSINVNQNGNITTTDGGNYDFNLASVDPTAIIGGNSVNLAGSFNGTTGTGGMQFGTLTGAAVLTNPALTPYPDFAGTTNTGILSPFALDYVVAAAVTTQLDETGLITPTVSVTDGINMNGSRVSNLGDGVDPADAVNKSQLDAEAAARVAADAAASMAIAAETTARTAADTALGARVDAEAATRANADTQLAAADNALGGRIDTEVLTRAQADLQINQRIDTEASSRAALGTALMNETSARVAADLSLSNRIDAFGSRLDEVDSRLSILDERISSSTAVAVAMSGNAFLPNTKFNLTANVGTYDGAHAGAFQMGALISSNVAINAGVATGFNKRGKTAARAGLTIGW